MFKILLTHNPMHYSSVCRKSFNQSDLKRHGLLTVMGWVPNYFDKARCGLASNMGGESIELKILTIEVNRS